MIQITDKHNCCGCSACVQVCPKQCISFNEDDKGFRYPSVNKKLCIDCGLCEKVCLMLNKREQVAPLSVSAAINENTETRTISSSGGIFTLLAEKTLRQGGVVFGAAFNEQWEVCHTYVENTAGLGKLRGAKYSQSFIGKTFEQTKEFLKQGRKVLFSGTGCQIAGLKLFLSREYENLLTVEIACHGVPSPKVWREYVKKISAGKSIIDINFRDKRNGWNGYGLAIKNDDGDLLYERATKNDYMQCFLMDLCLRPSCSNCPTKAGSSGADLLIGDFWGIDSLHPEMHDDKGCSLLIAYTKKHKEILDELNMKSIKTPYEEAYRYNRCIIESSHNSRYAPIFWYNFKKHGIDAAPKTLDILKSSKIIRYLKLSSFYLFGTI